VKPSVTLAETTLSGGSTLSLCRRDGHYFLRVAGRELMGTVAASSEMRLAELACEKLGTANNQRVLIGGLGFGFTLRRVLELVRPNVSVQVVELLPEVVAWNREYLQSINGGLVDDPPSRSGSTMSAVPNAHRAPVRRSPVRYRQRPGRDRGYAMRASRGPRAHGIVPRAWWRTTVFWSASTDRAF
jgi:hypothetical protein